jgi:hypothetical protein
MLEKEARRESSICTVPACRQLRLRAISVGLELKLGPTTDDAKHRKTGGDFFFSSSLCHFKPLFAAAIKLEW